MMINRTILQTSHGIGHPWQQTSKLRGSAPRQELRPEAPQEVHGHPAESPPREVAVSSEVETIPGNQQKPPQLLGQRDHPATRC